MFAKVLPWSSCSYKYINNFIFKVIYFILYGMLIYLASKVYMWVCVWVCVLSPEVFKAAENLRADLNIRYQELVECSCESFAVLSRQKRKRVTLLPSALLRQDEKLCRETIREWIHLCSLIKWLISLQCLKC